VKYGLAMSTLNWPSPHSSRGLAPTRGRDSHNSIMHMYSASKHSRLPLDAQHRLNSSAQYPAVYSYVYTLLFIFYVSCWFVCICMFVYFFLPYMVNKDEYIAKATDQRLAAVGTLRYIIRVPSNSMIIHCLKKTTLTLHTITSTHINRFW